MSLLLRKFLLNLSQFFINQLRGLFHRCLHDLSKKHGPVLLLRLGFIDMVVISSKEAAEEVLKVHDLECCTRPKTNASSKFSRDGKDIAFAPYGEVSRELRKLSLINFGQRLDQNKHVNKEKIEELMFEVQKVGSLSSSDIFPAGVGWFMDFVSGRHKTLHKVFVEVDTLLNHVIDGHLKNPEDKTNQDRPDIIDSILETIYKQEQDESFKLTIDHLKGIIQNIYLAGVDTSAITMIWAMAELVKNPRVMKKAQEEIRTCIGIKQKERIEEEDVDKLQYLKLVIKETLRLHPPAPLLLPRETMADIKIQGYDIPRKTILLVNAWSIGRNPELWENPFGSGRKICPGIAFGIATVELGLLNLLYYFDWRLAEEDKDIDMEEAGDATIVKKVPLELVPIIHH